MDKLLAYQYLMNLVFQINCQYIFFFWGGERLEGGVIKCNKKHRPSCHIDSKQAKPRV